MLAENASDLEIPNVLGDIYWSRAVVVFRVHINTVRQKSLDDVLTVILCGKVEWRRAHPDRSLRVGIRFLGLRGLEMWI